MGTSRLGRYGLETIHPEYELLSNELFVPSILPKYTLTKGLSQQRIRKTMNEAIRLLKDKLIFIDDLLPNNNFQSLENALSRIHNPNPEDKIDARLNTTRERAAAHKTSMLQDLERGRPLEIMPIIGATSELARLVQVPTPTIDTVLAIVKLRAKMTGQLPNT